MAFAARVADQNPLVNAARPDETRSFLDALPAAARQAADALTPGPGDMQPDEYLGLMDDLWQQRADHPRVDIWFRPPGPFWVTDDFMVQIAERAPTVRTGIRPMSRSRSTRSCTGRAPTASR